MNELSFLRWLVILNGAVPLLMLMNDAMRHRLGANSVNNALHITGILSLVFLFLSLLISPLRWITGWGGWVALRRSLGLYGFFYAVVHVFIYIYWDRAGNLPSTFREIWMRRFLQVGTVAVFLMIPLAVTSTNTMIRRLGSVRWKQLHRLAYVVAALGVLHYYMLVKSDVRQPLAFAGVLTILLGSRFGRNQFEQLQKARHLPRSKSLPVIAERSAVTEFSEEEPTANKRQWKGQLKVASIVQETPDVKTFRLMHADGSPLPFKYAAGQFINLQLTVDGKRVNRSYTLASSPLCEEYCELTIKRESHGASSRYLHDSLTENGLLSVSGPAGKFIFTDQNVPGIVLIAGGVGITPVMSILRTLALQNWEKPVYFLFAAKLERDLIFRSELQTLAENNPQIHLHLTLTREPFESSWRGHRGRIDGATLTDFIPNLRELPVFLCGPNDMIDGVRATLQGLGIPHDQIRTEVFSGRKSSPSSEPAKGDNLLSAKSGEAAPMKVVATTIQFVHSQRAIPCEPGMSVLEAAEQCGIEIPFECRSGICGQCKVKGFSGSVRMDCEDALSRSEKSEGYILACQAHPTSNITIEY